MKADCLYRAVGFLHHEKISSSLPTKYTVDVGADAHIGPFIIMLRFSQNPMKICGLCQRADVGIGPYNSIIAFCKQNDEIQFEERVWGMI